MNPAKAIDTTVRAMLTERGDRASSAAVARLVGLRANLWHVYTTGKSSPKYSTVRVWLDVLRENGFHLCLIHDPKTGTTAKVLP